jgi:hypothetical protein
VPLRQRIRVQQNIIKLILALEESFLDIARASAEPSVVIFDRGVMDSSAYVPPEFWEAMLQVDSWSAAELRDRRYDAVIHLVTAADGAELFYNTKNNLVRFETPEEARAVDARLRAAWSGHPRLHIIDNSTDFERKMARVLGVVSELVGVSHSHLPRPLLSR